MISEEVPVVAGQKGGIDSPSERLEVSPSIVKAYIVNTLKDLIALGSLAIVIYGVLSVVGKEFFIENLESLGIPLVYTMYLLIAVVVVVFAATFFSVLSLTSRELVFDAGKVTYSYGNFFKVTKTTDIDNIVRVNYKKYGYWGLGDIVIELSGSELKSLKVEYISDVGETCGFINDLITGARNGAIADSGVDGDTD